MSGTVRIFLTFIVPLLSAPCAQGADTDSGADAESLRLSRELSQRQQLIIEIRETQGNYHPALIEANYDLASSYIELGDFEQAYSQLEQALSIIRRNEGLYGASQLPLLGQMVKLRERLQDWQGAEDLQRLRLRIGMQVFEPGDSDYVETISSFAFWYLTSINEGTAVVSGYDRAYAYKELESLLERTLDYSSARAEKHDLDLLRLLYNQSLVLLTAADKYGNTMLPSPQFSTAPRFECHSRSSDAGPIEFCEPVPPPAAPKSNVAQVSAIELGQHSLKVLPQKLVQMETLLQNSQNISEENAALIALRLKSLQDEYARILQGH